jgi:endonuclease G, mitochondrial
MGYTTTFLDAAAIDLPKVGPLHPVLKNNVLLHYTHFSVFYSRDRKQPICTAVNINGKDFVEIKRKGKADKWLYDGNVGKKEQLGQDFYSLTNQDFHKGHIVRRLDPCWGNGTESKKAEADTFHYTNASPQHRKFNPAIWLELERNILEKGAVAHDEKISVLAGPVLSPADKPFIHQINNELIFIPHRFWKIIIWKKETGSICAVGFMQSQESKIDNWVDQSYGKDRTRSALDDHFENMKFKDDAVYQVNISEIEKVTGLLFDLKGIVLPKVKTAMKEVTRGIKSGLAYKGRYRSTAEENISVEGLVLE